MVACGALAKELEHVVGANGLGDRVRVEYLPAALHNRPDQIPGEVEAVLAANVSAARVLLAYGDCGTGGRLDALCDGERITRLPGAHCYEFFAGAELFGELADREPGTFYLTDYLARHFDRIVWSGLGLDRHPGLFNSYFANYRRCVHLTQSGDADDAALGRAAADRLGLEHSVELVGRAGLTTPVVLACQET